MIRRILLTVCVIFTYIVCSAQTERIDSVGSDKKMNGDTVTLKSHTGVSLGKDSVSDHYNLSFRYNPAGEPSFNYRMDHPLELKIPEMRFTPGQAAIFSWTNGAVSASGGRNIYPGLMRIDSGSIGVNQRVGNFTLNAGGVVNKYGYFRGLHTQYGLNGSIAYHFSSEVSFTVFGTYYIGRPPVMGGNLPMSPAMVGYYGVSKFGGYADYSAGERFGILVGGQAVQQVGTYQYEPEPIETPYLKVGSGKKKIAVGLPVGQILYGIFKR